MGADPIAAEQKPEALPKDKKRQVIREWRWWKQHPHKLTKLEDAFAVGCTDKEACGYADISERQLYYYEKMHPDFVGKKEVLKDRVVLEAKQTVAKKVKESYSNAMDYLKRRRKAEFGDNVDLTSGGEKLPPSSNAIQFVTFANPPDHAESK